jgi:uncharacterized protein YbjT (DUF2867 family)
MSGTLLLTGANGRTGRAMVERMANAGIPVRAFIRDPAQAEGLKTLGAAEFAIGDLADVESLRKAASGAAKVLHIGPPMHPQELSITRALIEAAAEAGVGHFIYYSVMHPQLRGIRHHRLKLDAEEYLLDSGLPHTIVQPSRYMQHLEPIWAQVVDQGLHAMPFSVERRFSLVDLADIAQACAVIAAAGDAFKYGTYELAGPEALSQTDMAAIVGDVIGRPVRARAVPLAEMRSRAVAAGASEDRIDQMEIMNRHYDAHGFQSNPHILQSVLGRPANSFRSYVERLARQRGAIAP